MVPTPSDHNFTLLVIATEMNFVLAAMLFIAMSWTVSGQGGDRENPREKFEQGLLKIIGECPRKNEIVQRAVEFLPEDPIRCPAPDGNRDRREGDDTAATETEETTEPTR